MCSRKAPFFGHILALDPAGATPPPRVWQSETPPGWSKSAHAGHQNWTHQNHPKNLCWVFSSFSPSRHSHRLHDITHVVGGCWLANCLVVLGRVPGTFGHVPKPAIWGGVGSGRLGVPAQAGIHPHLKFQPRPAASSTYHTAQNFVNQGFQTCLPPVSVRLQAMDRLSKTGRNFIPHLSRT